MTTRSNTRRAFLKGGGALIFLVVAGGVWRAYDQGVFATGTGPAYEPWADWRGRGAHNPTSLVSAAILAANAHNAQPWLFHVTPGTITLHADPDRNIGAMDSLRREMAISLGCAIENMCVAAPACGYDAHVTLMPDSLDKNCVARIDLASTIVKPSPLYDAIPHRHTDRGPFDSSQVIDAQTLAALSTLQTSRNVKLQWFADPALRDKIADQTVLATEAIVADKAMSQASASWFRSNWADIQRDRDGITLDAQGMSPLVTDIGKIAPPLSEAQADDVWLRSTRDTQTATASGYGIIAVADFANKAHLLEAGRLWQRLHLTATAQGLAMQPLNQIVERTDREVNESLPPQFGSELATLIGNPALRGVFLFRIGYPTKPALPSPRRSLQQVLI